MITSFRFFTDSMTAPTIVFIPVQGMAQKKRKLLADCFFLGKSVILPQKKRRRHRLRKRNRPGMMATVLRARKTRKDLKAVKLPSSAINIVRYAKAMTMKSNQFQGSLRYVNGVLMNPLAQTFKQDSNVYIVVKMILVKEVEDGRKRDERGKKKNTSHKK